VVTGLQVSVSWVT